jgi:hypothetical protein
MPQLLQDMAFLAFEISDNLSKTPEGFLVCHNVPIARTGMQLYLGEELGLQDKIGQTVKVYRLPEDVFATSTLMSFEGKPVTLHHPSEAVTPENAGSFVKGHAQNTRREGDYILADLMITDRYLISQIEGRFLREVSAGYGCSYEPYRDGYRQFNITANHIAVVPKGRAGPKVAIKDSKPVMTKKGAKKPMKKQEIMAAMLKAYAQDASPEEVAQAITLFDAAPEAPAKPEKKDEDGVIAKLLAALTKDSKPAPSEADKAIAALNDRLERIEKALTQDSKPKKAKTAKDEAMAILNQLLKDEGSEEEEETKDEEEKEAEDEASEEEKEAEDSDEEEEKKAEDSDEEEEKKEASDALPQLAQQLKRVIPKLSAKDQKLVKDALVKAMGRTQSTKSSYAGIQKVITKSSAKDAQPQADIADLGNKIAQAYNPHYKGKEAKSIFTGTNK